MRKQFLLFLLLLVWLLPKAEAGEKCECGSTVLTNHASVSIELGRLTNLPKIYDNLYKGLNDAGLSTAQKSGLRKILGELDEAGAVVSGTGRFSLQQIDEYVILATHNKNANKVMLGKYLDGGPNSYIQRAGSDYTYFDMGTTKWEEAESLVGKNADEMWKINKEFIDRQKALNKEFYFSQEPWKALSHEYLSKEAEYLIDLGAKDFQKINADTWKVIW